MLENVKIMFEANKRHGRVCHALILNREQTNLTVTFGASYKVFLLAFSLDPFGKMKQFSFNDPCRESIFTAMTVKDVQACAIGEGREKHN